MHTIATNQPDTVSGIAAVRNALQPALTPEEWARVNVTLRFGGVAVAIIGPGSLLFKVLRILNAELMIDG